VFGRATITLGIGPHSSCASFLYHQHCSALYCVSVQISLSYVLNILHCKILFSLRGCIKGRSVAWLSLLIFYAPTINDTSVNSRQPSALLACIMLLTDLFLDECKYFNSQLLWDGMHAHQTHKSNSPEYKTYSIPSTSHLGFIFDEQLTFQTKFLFSPNPATIVFVSFTVSTLTSIPQQPLPLPPPSFTRNWITTTSLSLKLRCTCCC